MTLIKTLISPQATSGSIVISVLAHGVFIGALALFLNLNPSHRDTSQDYLDIGYEIFDEPPPIAQEEKKMIRAPEPTAKIDPKAIPDNAPKELHDESSEVAGSQIAKAVANVGSETSGTAVAVPYYKIKPKYPRAALISGVEGWVLLNIDVTETGEVENVRVIDGERREMFQSEARRAVSQWKYRPFTDESGTVVTKHDHQVRVDFKLTELDSGG